MNRLFITPNLKKLNVLILMVAIMFASCSTNEDGLNTILDNDFRNTTIDLNEFQQQFPDYYDMIDFDSYQVADLIVAEDGIKKTVQMPVVSVVNNGIVIGYVGEFQGSTFYSENQVTRLINTDLKTGISANYPIIMVDGNLVIDFDNMSIINYEPNPEVDPTDKGWPAWVCTAGAVACIAACTTVVVVASGAATAGSGGTATPLVVVGATAAQTACVAACLVAEQACLNK